MHTPTPLRNTQNCSLKVRTLIATHPRNASPEPHRASTSNIFAGFSPCRFSLLFCFQGFLPRNIEVSEEVTSLLELFAEAREGCVASKVIMHLAASASDVSSAERRAHAWHASSPNTFAQLTQEGT